MPLGAPGRAAAAAATCASPSAQLRALIGYVASLGHGPPVPRARPGRGSVASGMRLFTEHCAGCHQIAARGGYLTGARRARRSTEATPTQIAEAVRIGPYLMPRFSRARDLGPPARLDRRVRPLRASTRGSGRLAARPPRARPRGDGRVAARGRRARRLLPRDREAAAAMTRLRDWLVARGACCSAGKKPATREPEHGASSRPASPTAAPRAGCSRCSGSPTLARARLRRRLRARPGLAPHAVARAHARRSRSPRSRPR